MKTMSLWFVLLAILLFGLPPVQAETASRPQAMVVFDASGSMWGQVQGRSKIQVARQVLSKVLADWNPDVALGLTVYGHRRKGDCNDIELLVPVGQGTADRLSQAVQGINPRGKTPISRALKQAAQAVRYTEEAATVILISDGKETCDADPCAAAAELAADGVDFVTHVIGFDVDQTTGKQLACIARATGGEYFAASDAASLTEAMRSVSSKVIDRNNVSLRAVLEENGPPQAAKVNIHGLDHDFAMGPIRLNDDSATKLQLPAGKYRINAQYQNAQVEQDFDVPEDEVVEVVVLLVQTGDVRLSAVEQPGGPVVKAKYRFYPLQDDGMGGEISRCYFPDGPCETRLPAGRYRVMVDYLKASKAVDIEVTAGKSLTQEVVMGGTGEVRLSAVEQPGGPVVKAKYRFYPVQDDGRSGGEISRCYFPDGPCKTQLPSGRYRVVVDYLKARKEVDVEVRPGEKLEQEVEMGRTGEVRLTAVEASGGPLIKAKYLFYPLRDDGRDGEITRCYFPDGPCETRLPAGPYEVFVQGKNGATTTIKIHIPPGSILEQEIPLPGAK